MRRCDRAIGDATHHQIDLDGGDVRGQRPAHQSGRFEIAWKDRAAEARERLGMPPTTEQVADEIASATAEALPSWRRRTR